MACTKRAISKAISSSLKSRNHAGSVNTLGRHSSSGSSHQQLRSHTPSCTNQIHHKQLRQVITWRGFCNANSFAPAQTRCYSQTTANPESVLGDKNIQQHSEQKRLKSSSDPTAKRPTQKCDPYGLQGESLPYNQCLDWMTTLDDGWVMLDSKEDPINMNMHADNVDVSNDPTIHEQMPITFLQTQYYHRTFHEASQFLSHITLLATNLNHYPSLSMERVLVDDINNIHGTTSCDGQDKEGSATGSERKHRKIKGWAFQSTICCSTYRPPTSKSEDRVDLNLDKGLTYHDFHLAMSVDVEANREEVKRLLWLDSSF